MAGAIPFSFHWVSSLTASSGYQWSTRSII